MKNSPCSIDTYNPPSEIIVFPVNCLWITLHQRKFRIDSLKQGNASHHASAEFHVQSAYVVDRQSSVGTLSHHAFEFSESPSALPVFLPAIDFREEGQIKNVLQSGNQVLCVLSLKNILLPTKEALRFKYRSVIHLLISFSVKICTAPHQCGDV